MRSRRAALLLALLATLTPAGRGDYEEAEQSGDMVGEDAAVEDAPLTTFDAVTLQLPTVDANFTHMAEDTMQLQLILMAAVPLALLILLVLIVVPFAIYYKRKRAKQEPSSQGSQNALQTCELGGDNMKVPIFEEDTPSVMEIEMEELDKWMSSMNRNADHECLPTLKEEKESSHSPSDHEP